MLLYRSLVVGMLGAIALLIAALPGELRERRAPPARPPVLTVSQEVLAHSPLPLDQTLASLMALGPGERVVGVEVLVSDGRTVRPVEVYWSTIPRLPQ